MITITKNLFLFSLSAILSLTLILVLPTTICAQDYKASLAQMPVYAESKDKGVLVDLVKAISKVAGKNIDYVVVPFQRSMDSVTSKKVNFHMPLIKLPNPPADLPYDYSTETIFHVNFTLYARKGETIDMKNIGNYKIETDLAHVPYFDFKIASTTDLAASVSKVVNKRIDGLIFADNAIDPIIKGLPDADKAKIQRQLYKVFDVKIILPKGENGKEVDQYLSKHIKTLRDSGEFAKIMSAIDAPFDNWQP
ncbi:MAG: transporter substrate-binding domain-containing protein [Oligoflexia bacterium]|nr:transporter substrate-binding domain-containing protein [Oligoflexia bacterium]